MDYREKFLKYYTENIRREGADRLLEYLQNASGCDFFTAPASTRYHGNYAGGLCEHSVNVYECLKDYLARTRVKDLYSLAPGDETVAIVALLHDICKVNVYKPVERWRKDANNKWESYMTFEYDDRMPYGHGEKSVYIISGFLRLTREEAFAIRYHMGLATTSSDEMRNVSSAFEMFPLALALNIADMEASFMLETRGTNQ